MTLVNHLRTRRGCRPRSGSRLNLRSFSVLITAHFDLFFYHLGVLENGDGVNSKYCKMVSRLIVCFPLQNKSFLPESVGNSQILLLLCNPQTSGMIILFPGLAQGCGYWRSATTHYYICARLLIQARSTSII